MATKNNTKEIGERSEAQIIAKLLRDGKNAVLLPFGDNQRYDLVLERKDKFIRVQCKTGRIRNGAIIFNTCSSSVHRNNGKKKPYYGEADLFGVYCPENDKVYLVPVTKFGSSMAYLRIEKPRNGNKKNIHWANKYELK